MELLLSNAALMSAGTMPLIFADVKFYILSEETLYKQVVL
jgi:hypothetical protein